MKSIFKRSGEIVFDLIIMSIYYIRKWRGEEEGVSEGQNLSYIIN